MGPLFQPAGNGCLPFKQAVFYCSQEHSVCFFSVSKHVLTLQSLTPASYKIFISKIFSTVVAIKNYEKYQVYLTDRVAFYFLAFEMLHLL